MRLAWPLMTTIVFALFGYLVVRGEAIILATVTTLLSAVIIAPTILALFNGSKNLLKKRSVEAWFVTLVISFFCYILALKFVSTAEVSLLAVLTLACWIGFPFLASSFLPYSLLFGTTLLAILWLPFDHRATAALFLWPPQMLDYPLNAFLVTSTCLLLFTKLRPVKPLIADLPWRLTPKDIGIVATCFVALCCFLIPAAMAMEFIAYKGLPELSKPALAFLGIFFTIALPEELVFRGILQTKLSDRLGSAGGIFLAAALFGLTHWNNGSVMFDWRYILLATCAGVGYGLAYRTSGRLIVPVMVHTLVDTTWVSLFK